MLKKQEILIPIALFGLAFLCYASIIPTYFLSDDFAFIGKIIRQGMFYTWGESSGGFLRPGTLLSYVADYWIWGLNPAGYHLTNILFHGLAAYAVFHICRHFLRKAQSSGPVLFSFLAACLFIALPCHSESVSWISGRTDVIAVALGLAATGCFLAVLEKRSLPHAILAVVLLVSALLTKESVIVLPLLWCAVFVHDWWSAKKAPPVQAGLLVMLSCLVLAGYFLLRKAVLGQFIGGYGTVHHLAIIQMRSVVNLLRYVFRTFMPALPLRFDILNDPHVLLAVVLAAGVLAAVLVFLWRRELHWPLVVLLVLCYLGSLVPVITFRVQICDTQAERFLYLPSAFACILAAYVAAAGIRSPRAWAAALSCFIAVEAVALNQVNKRWITASHLTRQIAAEVAQADPARTVVLNVPDNFRGAYVFRNGLSDAATVFTANQAHVPYRVICGHNLNSVAETVEACSDGASITLSLPPGISFEEVHDVGLDVRATSNSLVVSEGLMTGAGTLSFLSFKTANSVPMFRKLGWNRQADTGRQDPEGSPHVPSLSAAK